MHVTPTVLALAFFACPMFTSAQSAGSTLAENGKVVQIVHLRNAATDSEASNVDTAIRNMVDPQTKVYLVMETHDIVLSGTPAQVEAAARLANALDQPKRSYRLTFTLAEFENGHRVGVQHFAMDAIVGQRVILKQGNRVPTPTGNMTEPGLATQFTYNDVGVNFDFTLDQLGSGLRLRSKVEESTASDSVTVGRNIEPIIRQSTLEGTTALVPSKATNIGGIDIFGSTRHVDVEVIAEPLS